jgi:hypothetical protein
MKSHSQLQGAASLRIIGSFHARRHAPTLLAAASMSHPQQLLIIGLNGERLFVAWHEHDTVGDIKHRAFAAAADVTLADGTRQSLVGGVTAEQVRLVYGRPGDPINLSKLDDASLIIKCLSGHVR